jgi:hypothetical protein
MLRHATTSPINAHSRAAPPSSATPRPASKNTPNGLFSKVSIVFTISYYSFCTSTQIKGDATNRFGCVDKTIVNDSRGLVQSLALNKR